MEDLGNFFEDVVDLAFEIDRHVIPIGAGIVVGYFSGCVPCGAAVGAALSSAINTAYAGGSLEDVVLASAIGGGIGYAAGAVGGVAGYGVGEVAGSFAGAVVGGAVGGATAGGLSAAIYGGNVGESAAYGAVVGAVTAAAMYAGYEAYASISAARGQAGGDSRLGAELTNDERIAIGLRGYESTTGEDVSGVRVYETGAGRSHLAGEMIDRDTITINPALFDNREQLYLTLGHELRHITQARTTWFFGLRYTIAHRWHGYWNNPYEVQAERAGARFASQMLDRWVEPNPRYGR